MKKTAIIIFFGLFFCAGIFAVETNSATDEGKLASPSAVINEKDTRDFKEKVVDALNKQHKDNNTGISGVVTQISGNTIKIKTANEESYDIKVDDLLTKFYQIVGAQKKEINIQNLEKNQYVIVTGVVSDKTITANLIYVDDQYLVKSGKISEVDKEAFFIKVVSTDKDSYTLDVETFTKQQMLNIKTLAIERIGFSKIKEGDTIHFVVKKTGTEKEINRFPAQKVLIIPQEYFIK